ncbi:distal membrane arm assembly component 2 [Calliopsis andreniformis]|uniref:distal membrane arm assembly component 2 n=1 Tax=Calliopsis andreniformis TaxID=337506 RepID=UPI003FCCC119
MLRQCCTYNVPKQISECITSRKLYDTIRTFYNDNRAITVLSEDLHKRKMIGTSKTERPRKLMLPSSPSFTKLVLSTTRAPEAHHFFTFHWKKWWEHKKKNLRNLLQANYYKTHLPLGPDLAAAYFVIQFGGRVKFKNHDEWIEAFKKKGIPQLPTYNDPKYILEAIDLKGYSIEFDNLGNISNLYHLKWLSLKGCKTIDDWAIDKLSSSYPALEYFDISECINVTERGLEALYRMPNLKKLIVTNYYKSVALELTCFMLEDINPFLECEILEPETKLLPRE